MKCGRKCEVFARVVGYHRPVRHWNDGKKEEFKSRKHFTADCLTASKDLEGTGQEDNTHEK